MSHWKRWILLGLSVAATSVLAAPASAWDPLQKAQRLASQAGKMLKEGRTQEALQTYLQAQALSPDDPDIRMGVAEALYRSGEAHEDPEQQGQLLESSSAQYVAAAAQGDAAHEQQGFYNAGNAAFAQGNLEAAVELYGRALLSGEPDPDVLYNLELAQRLLEQAEQQPQEDQDGEPQEDQEQEQNENQDGDPQEQEQQQGEDGEQQDQEQQQQQEQEQQQEEQEQQEQEQQEQEEEAQADSTQTPPAPQDSTAQAQPDSLSLPPPEGMTPEQAQRLLDALDADEEELRRSIQRRLRGTARQSEKDW